MAKDTTSQYNVNYRKIMFTHIPIEFFKADLMVQFFFKFCAVLKLITRMQLAYLSSF